MKIRKILKDTERYWYFFLIPLIVFWLVCYSYFMYWQYFNITPFFNQEKADFNRQSKQYQYFSQLTGQGATTKAEQMPAILAITIDNHPDALQKGLSQAKIVYEFPVEGVFTRFLGIFSQEQNIEQVGPVRSARDYFFDVVSEYGQAIYLHSGGSPLALSYLSNYIQYPFFNADEFALGKYFYRDDNYYAPHNLFTDSKKWLGLFDYFEQYLTTTTWSGWKFGPINTTSTQEITSIQIPYGTVNKIEWKYDKTANQYQRYANDQITQDEKNKYEVKNVIIEFHSSYIMDNDGRLSVRTKGEDEGYILRDGKIIKITWKKQNQIDRTRYYDENNQEVNLSPGKSWVMIVPSQIKVVVSN